MADENLSKLFLDATQVINTLTTLTKAFETYGARLDSFTAKATNFNKSEESIAKSAKDATDALNKQQQAADNASQALNKLQGGRAPDFAKSTPAQIARVNSAVVAFQNAAQKSGLSLTQLNGIVNNLGGQYTGMSAKVAAAGNRYVAAVNAMGAANKGLNVTASLGSLLKVFAIQEAVSVLRSLTAALGQSVEEARKFELQIAAVLTISKELAADGIDKTAASVARLAAEFGQPIGDVAKGLYETISNQVGDAGESFSFLTTTLTFARATMASTADAGNLLSGIMNAYGLKASSATRASDILFKTIDVGRVTASDLADTFGRVLPLAASLGISLEEVSAQLATLTIQGLSADESLTQISNVMLKLLKPNEELKALLKSLGFESVQAGIAAFGYQGLLQKLLDTTDGSSEATGELFNQVRALKGVLGITGDKADLYAKSLKAIRDNSTGAAQAASDLIKASPAAQFTKQFETVKAIFTDEFGRQAIKTIVVLVESLGGAEHATRTFVTGLNALIATFTVLGAVPVAFLGNFIAGLDALSGSLKDRTREANNLVDAISRSRDDAIKNEIAANASQVQNRKNSVQASVALVEQQFAAYQRMYNEDEKNAILAQKKISDSLKSQLDDRLNAVQALQQKLQQVQNDAIKKQKDAKQDTLDLDFRINQGKFDNSLSGKDDPQKAAALIARSQKLLDASKEALRKGNEDFSGKLFGESISAAEKAAGITGQRARGEAQLNKLLQEQVGREQAIIDLEQQKAQIAAAEQEKIAAKENELRNLITEFNDIQNQITKSKGELTETQLASLSKQSDTLAKGIEKTLGSISISKLIDFDISRIQKPFISPTTNKPVKLDFAVTESIASLQETLSKTLLKIPVQFIADVKSLTGVDASKLGGFRGVQSTVAKDAANLSKSIENAENEMTRLKGEGIVALTLIDARANQAVKSFEDLKNAANAVTAFSDTSGRIPLVNQLTQVQEAIRNVQKEAKAAISSGDLEAITKSQQSLARVAATLTNPVGSLAKVDLSQAKISISQLNVELAEAKKDIADLGNVTNQFQQGLKDQQAFQGLGEQVKQISNDTKTLDNNFTEAGIAGQTGASNTAAAMQGVTSVTLSQVSALDALVQKYGQVEQAAKQAAAAGAAAGAPAQGNSKGGPVHYFATGGPVGTDTIAAYLSPREYVMDAEHATQYATELRSMSRGDFDKSDFGISNNTTIGDVNINLNGTASKESAREMADEFHRQIRLRTIRRF